MSSNYDNKLTDQVKRMRPLLAHIALGTCRVIEQATGWYISAGSSTTKYLEHGTSFRLDSSGNARGTGAVDLQQARDNDAQVASGIQSFIAAGDGNTASGTFSGIVTSWDSVASGTSSMVLGGQDNTASGELATVINGYDNEAATNYSVALGGGAKTNTRFQMAHGAYRTSFGDSQVCRYVGSDNIGMGTSGLWFPISTGVNGVVIPTDTVMTFNALVVGTTSGCTKSFGYRIEGVVENDGGTTSLLGSTVTTIYEDDANFNCRAVGNNTDDVLEIEVVDAGLSGDSVAWTVRIDTAEVTNPA